MRMRKPDATINLEELKRKIQEHKDKGRELIVALKCLISHFERMQEYYSEWEDRMNAIQNEINKASEEHGVPIEQIEEYDALADMLGGTQ